MLEDKLKEQEESILKKIEEYELLVAKYNELQKKISSKEKEIADINQALSDKVKEILSLTNTNKRNNFLDFIRKHFSKKYKEVMRKETEKIKIKDTSILLNKEMSELRNERDNVERKIKSYSIEELRSALAEQNDRGKAIHMLLSAQPQLRKDINFMKELMEVSVNFIIYDKTDDPELYLMLIDKVLDKDILASYSPSAEEFYRGDITRLEAEIRTPKSVESTKYKVPHKYLFDSIRRYGLANEGFAGKPGIEIITEVFRAYERLDGVVDKEYGESIQTMYEDQECYLLQHIMDLGADRSHEHAKKVRELICKNGLRCGEHQPSQASTLKTTTLGNYQVEGTFLKMLEPKDKVFMMIPKGAIEKDHEIPVWGADTQIIDQDAFEAGKRNYVLPEYVMGYVDIESQQFINNKVPKSERKKYPYKFYEGEHKAIQQKYEITR